MEAIYPVTDLQRNQGEVKAAAREGVVRVTENGRGAYVFCSEDVFERALSEAAERAVLDARLEDAVFRGMEDVEAGRIYEGSEATLTEIARRRAARG